MLEFVFQPQGEALGCTLQKNLWPMWMKTIVGRLLVWAWMEPVRGRFPLWAWLKPFRGRFLLWAWVEPVQGRDLLWACLIEVLDPYQSRSLPAKPACMELSVVLSHIMCYVLHSHGHGRLFAIRISWNVYLLVAFLSVGFAFMRCCNTRSAWRGRTV